MTMQSHDRDSSLSSSLLAATEEWPSIKPSIVNLQDIAKELNRKRKTRRFPHQLPSEFRWKWDDTRRSNEVTLHEDNTLVVFHSEYSRGNAAVKGDLPFQKFCQHYWEVQLCSTAYGTDMTMGICTDSLDVNASSGRFRILMKESTEGMGLQYTGLFIKDGQYYRCSSSLKKDDIVGFHLDLWNGCLSVYVNDMFCGIMATKLHTDNVYYPFVCSTAARTQMKLLCSFSCETSLEYLAVTTIVRSRRDLDLIQLVSSLRCSLFTKYLYSDLWIVKVASQNRDGAD